MDLTGIAYTDRAQLYPERRRHPLHGGKLANPRGAAGVPKHGHACQTRRHLLEQLQPFRAHTEFEQCESGGIAARPGQACDEAGAYRIGNLDEHQRHAAGRLLQWHHGRDGSGQDDVRCKPNQFRRISPKAIGIARGPTHVDPHVATVGPAQLLQTLHERGQAA